MPARGSTRPTKADVARLANVSTATVSYVLNNVVGQRISEQTCATVRRAADELGYRPNLAARNLAVGGSGVVLYIMPRMALGPLPMEVGSRLTTALARRGIVLSLQFETDDDQNIIEAIETLHPMAIYSVFPLRGKALAAAEAIDVPQNHLGGSLPDALGALNDSTGEMRVDHLVDRGHRRLAFAYTDDPVLRALGDYWLAGLAPAVRRRALPALTLGTLAADGSDAAAVVRGWLDAGLTAVCAQSDEVAFVVLHGLRQLGAQCPRDLAVIGVDANPLGAVSAPPLTSVSFDAKAVVDLAVAAMMGQLGLPGEPAPPGDDVAVLIEREST
jgi:DNA-binding LacI/PurR family transcriptional regulator